MATSPRRPASGSSRTRKATIKLTAAIDASLYVRLAAGAAMRQISHSRFVADAIELALREQGVFVGTRRSAADPVDPTTQEKVSGDTAADLDGPGESARAEAA